MTPHDLVDAEAREWLSVRREDRRLRRRWWVQRLEQRGQQRRRLMPEWAGPPLVALAVQTDEWVVTEIEVFNTKIGGLLNPRSGVVEEEQEGPVPQSEAAVAGQVAEEILDLVAFEESCFRWSHTFHRHSGHALADDEQFGCSPSDVLEQAVHSSQALVARANVVTPLDFEMLEKADDPLESEGRQAPGV